MTAAVSFGALGAYTVTTKMQCHPSAVIADSATVTPNYGMEPTTHSVRSFLALASRCGCARR
jgi:hypothetical protein